MLEHRPLNWYPRRNGNAQASQKVCSHRSEAPTTPIRCRIFQLHITYFGSEMVQYQPFPASKWHSSSLRNSNAQSQEERFCPMHQKPSSFYNSQLHIKWFFKRYSQHQSCSQHLPPFRPRFLDAPKAKTEWQYEHSLCTIQIVLRPLRTKFGSKTSKFTQQSLRCLPGAAATLGCKQRWELIMALAVRRATSPSSHSHGECTHQQYPQQYWLVTS